MFVNKMLCVSREAKGICFIIVTIETLMITPLYDPTKEPSKIIRQFFGLSSGLFTFYLILTTFKKFKMNELTKNDIIELIAVGIILSLIIVQIVKQ